MIINRFDTFEDEKEISEMINKMQSQSIKYMQQPDAWEFHTKQEYQNKTV